MAAFISRYPRNVAGKYYVDADCLDCDLCRETAPHTFCRDDETGMSYVYRQPVTPEEITLCEESIEGCPHNAIGHDGEQFDWREAPIRDWLRYSESLRPAMEGLNVLTVEQERQLPRTCRLRPPPPRSPQELLEMLVHIFPNYRASDTNPILDGAASFDSVLTAFRPFFGAGAASFSEQQIRAFSSLMVGAAFLNGPLANAFTTCIIEHLDRINAREALWRFLSPNARDAVRRASTSNP